MDIKVANQCNYTPDCATTITARKLWSRAINVFLAEVYTYSNHYTKPVVFLNPRGSFLNVSTSASQSNNIFVSSQCHSYEDLNLYG